MTINYEKQFSSLFQQLADTAGEIASLYFRSNLNVETKDDKSPVTAADRAIEEKLREIVHKAHPSHGFIGEEFGSAQEDAEFVWVVDPIDGTRAFMTGKPLFGTIIGLMHAGQPAMGVLEQPFTHERWMGISHTLATWNGKPIRVAASRHLHESRMYIGSPNMFDDENLESYLKICRTARWPQYGCDCYAYGLMAMGCADLVVEQQLKIYDVAGLVPIVTGAGGYIGTWDFAPIDIAFKGGVVAASSRELAEEAVSILQGS